MLLRPERTYPNRFDACPPFPIDGNFGGAAGIAEMLLQSHVGGIELLPALPKAWPTGSVNGPRARGAFEVDLAWRTDKLTGASIRSLAGQPCRVRYRDKVADLTTEKGNPYLLNAELARPKPPRTLALYSIVSSASDC
jgi:alpha-L-fucosidase 2